MGKLLGLWIWLSARLKEPSTLASLAAILAMFGVHLEAGAIQNFLNVGTLVFGTLGFFVSEQGPTTKV
jgi:uncharacterized membrane protein